jgi:predicted acylesterase/phospholipase RssA
VLIALDLKIDVFASCSIGAYVDSAYAINKLPSDINGY